MSKIPLHWKIIIGMVFGVLLGLLMSAFSWGKEFVIDWIAPFGTIFIRLLKLIAIPLIFVSLIKGISDLKDISSFRDIGFRTIMLYISTTVVAVTIGLLLVNVLQPGRALPKRPLRSLPAPILRSRPSLRTSTKQWSRQVVP